MSGKRRARIASHSRRSTVIRGGQRSRPFVRIERLARKQTLTANPLEESRVDLSRSGYLSSTLRSESFASSRSSWTLGGRADHLHSDPTLVTDGSCVRGVSSRSFQSSLALVLVSPGRTHPLRVHLSVANFSPSFALQTPWTRSQTVINRSQHSKFRGKAHPFCTSSRRPPSTNNAVRIVQSDRFRHRGLGNAGSGRVLASWTSRNGVQPTSQTLAIADICKTIGYTSCIGLFRSDRYRDVERIKGSSFGHAQEACFAPPTIPFI